MKPSRLLKSFVLFVTASAFAAPKPAAPSPPKPVHRSPLAEHLARSEASVRALEHHLATAAQRKAVLAADAKLVERAKKLARHHVREPLLWREYVRRVPAGIVVDETTFRSDVVELEAERTAAALGDNLDALWARRKLVQAERMVLWSKIAFRAVAEMELSDHPLYRFEYQAGPAPLDAQRVEAMKAVTQFVRIVDHLANQAQEAVEIDPRAVYMQWHKLLSTARLQMQDKLLLQGQVAMDVYKPQSEAGQLAASAKQLADLAQTIVDAEKALAAAENVGDDEEADVSRAQLQQALADTAGAVAALDASVVKAATAWNIAVVPGTKAAVAELPDLAGGGNGTVTSTVVSAPGERVFLTNLGEISVKTFKNNDWGFGKHGKLSSQKQSLIRVRDIPSPNGLGLHPPRKGASIVAYSTAKEFHKFEGAVALDDSSHGLKTPVTFRVIGDGRELWHSRPIDGPQILERFSVEIDGIDRLEIMVDCPGEHDGAHAVWIEPVLSRGLLPARTPAVSQAPLAPPAGAVPVAVAPQPAPPPAGAVTRTALIGNERSAEFQEDAPAGAILVGFDLTMAKHKAGAPILKSARPIWRTAAGDVPGRQLGTPTSTVTHIVARPGYGVVAVDIHLGPKHILGMIFHFMRINGNAAVASDAYDGAPYGSFNGPSQKIGEGKPIVGLFGESGANVDKLGLVMRN